MLLSFVSIVPFLFLPLLHGVIATNHTGSYEYIVVATFDLQLERIAVRNKGTGIYRLSNASINQTAVEIVNQWQNENIELKKNNLTTNDYSQSNKTLGLSSIIEGEQFELSLIVKPSQFFDFQFLWGGLRRLSKTIQHLCSIRTWLKIFVSVDAKSPLALINSQLHPTPQENKQVFLLQCRNDNNIYTVGVVAEPGSVEVDSKELHDKISDSYEYVLIASFDLQLERIAVRNRGTGIYGLSNVSINQTAIDIIYHWQEDSIEAKKENRTEYDYPNITSTLGLKDIVEGHQLEVSIIVDQSLFPSLQSFWAGLRRLSKTIQHLCSIRTWLKIFVSVDAKSPLALIHSQFYPTPLDNKQGFLLQCRNDEYIYTVAVVAKPGSVEVHSKDLHDDISGITTPWGFGERKSPMISYWSKRDNYCIRVLLADDSKTVWTLKCY
ncbi:uncharacterized protein RJT20DRAFT_3936 [Scheffersomyces xylosifermentans]|uniref:uncharacterized protein n=1 Tax=Scheffersomyces xylosifermentans TaxID=1304137 RepID=UPI00315DB60F